MPFRFTELPIQGAFLIEPHVFEDERGKYKKVFHSDSFLEHNLPIVFGETSDIISKKGAVRGLHYQKCFSQAKLIHVVKGKLYDVFLDLRKESSTYLKHFEICLSSDEDVILFIPDGCAHGFMALEEDTIFSYQCTNKYDEKSCGGIIWNDQDLNIKWPLKNNLIISEKDKKWPTLREYLEKNNG